MTANLALHGSAVTDFFQQIYQVFTPKALNLLAQGCRTAATLGKGTKAIIYPEGVASPHRIR